MRNGIIGNRIFEEKTKIMEEKQLLKAENAIIELAESLKISEALLVSIIRRGMEFKSPVSNQLSNSEEFFLTEMEFIFGTI